MFAWLEETALSVWVREWPSVFGFPFILFLHTLGLGIVGGLSVALDLWFLRHARGRSPLALAPFIPIVWLGFAIALVSGLLLLIGYPTKALTNEVFYVKIALIVVALFQLQWLRRRALAAADLTTPYRPDVKTRVVAAVSIVLWVGAVFLGRLLAYTYNYLMAGDPPGVA